MKNDLTILVVSYDGYSDMWDNFFGCKEKFWPDCPYATILANNSIDYKRDGVQTLNCGKDALWSLRTNMALHKIQSKYVCFVLEDFFFSAPINTSDFETAIKLMEENKIQYYKLLSFSSIETPSYKGLDYLKEIPDNLPYGISLMSAIWDREFFLEKIGKDNYNPWKFEVDRILEEKGKDGSTLVGVYDSRNPLNICHMAVQGKYLPPAIKKMKDCGITIDTTKRGVMSASEYGVYSFKRWASQWTDKHTWAQKIVHILYRGSVTSKYL